MDSGCTTEYLHSRDTRELPRMYFPTRLIGPILGGAVYLKVDFPVFHDPVGPLGTTFVDLLEK